MLLALVVTSVRADESSQPTSNTQKRYNVLFIAVDDLNDWVGCLGGNAQAITPNLDRLAKQQAMVMNKAYCPSTVCCPSRSSILTGKRPSTTGIYGNTQDLKKAPKARDLVTLPEYIDKHGYHTLSTGKIFHKHPTASGMDEGQWAFQEFTPGGAGNKGMLWEESPSSVLGEKAREKGPGEIYGKRRGKGDGALGSLHSVCRRDQGLCGLPMGCRSTPSRF